MVKVRQQSNVALRRPSGHGGSAGVLGFLSTVPFLSRLAPADRLVLVLGASLITVATLAYVVLLTDAFSGEVSAGGSVVDPRLSSELRKTGLSNKALLRRGGGKRISKLDPSENAIALDVISTLHCDRVQEELDEQWQKVLVEEKKRLKEEREYQKEWGRGGNNDYNPDAMGGDAHTDEYASAKNRRMLDEADGGDVGSGDGPEGDTMMDDAGYMGGGEYNSFYDENKVPLTARHLFCLAADALVLPKPIKSSGGGGEGLKAPSVECNVSALETRESLLGLWSSARALISDVSILERTLDLAREHQETLRGWTVNVWYPEGDTGAEGSLRVINSGHGGREKYNFDAEKAEDDHDDLYRFWDLPSRHVGPNKLFVDVGSALGFASMLVARTYPRTVVVSVEPASPSWLLQQINFRCNLNRETELPYVHSILAGVGETKHEEGGAMMKMLWRPSMTTSTRSWNPERDYNREKDIELVVRLRTLRSILAEATPEDLPLGTPISVMNLDCEGCEYNLVPSMHDATFRAIGILLGRTSWGFIPLIKKPSSERAQATHRRLCGHYNFAKRCKECCEFSDLEVKARIHDDGGGGETAGGDSEGEEEDADAASSRKEGRAVSEVAGPLCEHFEEWAAENRLHNVPDDYGWEEISAFAADEDPTPAAGT